LDPNVLHLDKAVKRLEKKIAHGANYVLTQPIYNKEKIMELKEATAHLDVPIFIGVMPITSTKNAEFLHNEVPGITLTDDVRERKQQEVIVKRLLQKVWQFHANLLKQQLNISMVFISLHHLCAMT